MHSVTCLPHCGREILAIYRFRAAGGRRSALRPGLLAQGGRAPAAAGQWGVERRRRAVGQGGTASRAMPRPRHSSQNVHCLRRRTTLAPLACPSLAALPPLPFRVSVTAAVAAALCAWCATSGTAARWREVFETVWEQSAEADDPEDRQLQFNWDSVFGLLEDYPLDPPRRRGADGCVALRPPVAPWRLMCAGKLMGWGGAKGRAPPPISGSPFNGRNGEREEGVHLSSPVRPIAPPCPQPHPTKQHLNVVGTLMCQQREWHFVLCLPTKSPPEKPCPEMLGVAAAAPAPKRRRA
eukprot:gene22794-biopygen4264